MPAHVSIHNPPLLYLRHYGRTTCGASQSWYRHFMQRMGGCGPTCGAHIAWYLSRTKPECAALCPYDAGEHEGFLQLMEETWKFITPGPRGVNTTAMFADGICRYAADHGVSLGCRILDVPKERAARPDWAQALEFLAGAFADDLPVAFLNLDNGNLRNLERWHWVTLVAVDSPAGQATMFDQGRRAEIELQRWLRTTALGGGFVAAEPRSAAWA